MITTDEIIRLSQIKKCLRKYERAGIDTSTWEAPFFLGIIDRFVKYGPKFNKESRRTKNGKETRHGKKNS